MLFRQNDHRKWLSLTYVVVFFLLELLIVTNSSVILGFDHSIQALLQGTVNSPLTRIFTAISFLGSPLMDVIYILIIMTWLFWKDHKPSSLWLGFVLIVGNIVSYLVKITVRRQRPLEKVIPASGYSFPSGHVFGTTLVVLAIIVLLLPYLQNSSAKSILKILLIVWVIIVALSRVYLRGHFPSDVIGSALLAGTWWECAELLYIRYHSFAEQLFKQEVNQNK